MRNFALFGLLITLIPVLSCMHYETDNENMLKYKVIKTSKLSDGNYESLVLHAYNYGDGAGKDGVWGTEDDDIYYSRKIIYSNENNILEYTQLRNNVSPYQFIPFEGARFLKLAFPFYGEKIYPIASIKISKTKDGDFDASLFNRNNEKVLYLTSKTNNMIQIVNQFRLDNVFSSENLVDAITGSWQIDKEKDSITIFSNPGPDATWNSEDDIVDYRLFGYSNLSDKSLIPHKANLSANDETPNPWVIGYSYYRDELKKTIKDNYEILVTNRYIVNKFADVSVFQDQFIEVKDQNFNLKYFVNPVIIRMHSSVKEDDNRVYYADEITNIKKTTDTPEKMDILVQTNIWYSNDLNVVDCSFNESDIPIDCIIDYYQDRKNRLGLHPFTMSHEYRYLPNGDTEYIFNTHQPQFDGWGPPDQTWLFIDETINE